MRLREGDTIECRDLQARRLISQRIQPCTIEIRVQFIFLQFLNQRVMQPQWFAFKLAAGDVGNQRMFEFVKSGFPRPVLRFT